MGGIGSGRHAAPGPRVAQEGCLVFDLGALRRAGLLAPEQTQPAQAVLDVADYEGLREIRVAVLLDDPPRLQLSYRMSSEPTDEEGQEVEVAIDLVREPMPRGGTRLCMVCPSCGVPVRKLYLAPGVSEFACRKCVRGTQVLQPPRSSDLDGQPEGRSGIVEGTDPHDGG